MPILTKPHNYDTIEDVREAIAQSKEEFKILQRHWTRLMEMYEDFEDVLVKLEKRLLDLELGMEPDELTELKEKVAKLEADNISLTKTTRQAKKFKEAESISDLIGDLVDGS